MSIFDDLDTHEKELPRAGSHRAICWGLFPVGWQEIKNKKTGEIKYYKQAVLIFELAEKMKDGRPFVVSNTYNLSTFTQSHFIQHFSAWENAQLGPEYFANFNPKSFRGRPARVSITLNEGINNTYVNLSGISSPDPEDALLELHNPEAPPSWVVEKEANALTKDEVQRRREQVRENQNLTPPPQSQPAPSEEFPTKETMREQAPTEPAFAKEDYFHPEPQSVPH